jgi:hypothetical protein
MYKRKLLHFLKTKSKLIKSLCGLVYVTKADLFEVENIWTEKECKEVFLAMPSNLNDPHIDSSDLCPWCIHIFSSDTMSLRRNVQRRPQPNQRWEITTHYGVVCSRCGYGERNGICMATPLSRWKKLCARIPDGIVYLVDKHGNIDRVRVKEVRKQQRV